MLRVGLTGGIASGKSTVAAELAARGAVVIDADVLAREVVAPGTAALAAVQDRFGDAVLTPNGELDRAHLGRIVFADTTARRDLEQIIHPAVRRRAAELEQQAAPDAIVVHVIPLLVETEQADQFDVVVVVDTDREAQLTRLAERNGYSRADAAARIDAQATREQRRQVADVVLDNSGTPEDLAAQVAELWAGLAAREMGDRERADREIRGSKTVGGRT